jgi:hypothetical protein
MFAEKGIVNVNKNLHASQTSRNVQVENLPRPDAVSARLVPVGELANIS